MRFQEGEIQGVEVRYLKKHVDSRGWLMELYRLDELSPDRVPVLSTVSEIAPRTARGPYEHRSHGDYLCFLGPSPFEVALWDNRPDSPTFRCRQVVLCGEGLPCALVVPPGVVLSYRNRGDQPGWVFNFPNRFPAERSCGEQGE